MPGVAPFDTTIWDMTHADEAMRTVEGDKVNTLNSRMGTGGNQVQVVCQPITFNLRGREGGAMPEVDPDTLANIRAASGGSSKSYVAKGYKVRRLTPTECERLQGFPDGWTDGFPDAVRYKALGNSVAVPCVEFVMEGVARCAKK